MDIGANLESGVTCIQDRCQAQPGSHYRPDTAGGRGLLVEG